MNLTTDLSEEQICMLYNFLINGEYQISESYTKNLHGLSVIDFKQKMLVIGQEVRRKLEATQEKK